MVASTAVPGASLTGQGDAVLGLVLPALPGSPAGALAAPGTSVTASKPHASAGSSAARECIRCFRCGNGPELSGEWQRRTGSRCWSEAAGGSSSSSRSSGRTNSSGTLLERCGQLSDPVLVLPGLSCYNGAGPAGVAGAGACLAAAVASPSTRASTGPTRHQCRCCCCCCWWWWWWLPAGR